MKGKIGYISILLLLVFILSGCATPYPMGAFYTEIKSPVAGAGSISYTKVGVAKATSVLGLVATGDASIKTAAANGGVKKIKFVDYESKNILGIFGEYTTTVYGD